MNSKHLTRLVAVAMGAATVGAVALPAQEAHADASSVLRTQGLIDWTNVGGGVFGEPWFAEYHDHAYVQKMSDLGNWGWWQNGGNVIRQNP